MIGAETWRAVEGWPYEVSSEGRVRRTGPATGATVGKTLTPVMSPNGYLGVTLSSGGRQRQVSIHTLVCAAFHGPRPAGHHARHLDGDQVNNRESNLRWGTPRENANDKREHGTLLSGDRHPRTKISEADYAQILADWDGHARGYGKTGAFIAATMRRFGVSKGFVEDAIYGSVRATRVRQARRVA